MKGKRQTENEAQALGRKMWGAYLRFKREILRAGFADDMEALRKAGRAQDDLDDCLNRLLGR